MRTRHLEQAAASRTSTTRTPLACGPGICSPIVARVDLIPDTFMHAPHIWREACGIPRSRVQCDIVSHAPHKRTPPMPLLTALALLPFAAIANFAFVVALANHFDADKPATGLTGPVPTLA
jgi:hypothetical protein